MQLYKCLSYFFTNTCRKYFCTWVPHASPIEVNIVGFKDLVIAILRLKQFFIWVFILLLTVNFVFRGKVAFLQIKDILLV